MRRDDLAPVIPLFGDRAARALPSDRAARAVPSDRGAAPESGGAPEWDTTWIEARASRAEAVVVAGAGEVDLDGAEAALLRKLRARQLSTHEARGVLRDHGLAAEVADIVIEAFEQRGYLDDQRLAEQLSYAAVTRKGQGRRAIAQALTARGIPRAVADEAIAELPDDDEERAIEFARTKVRRGGALDRETALRRLVGQLTRRGYSSSLAMSAARTALDEQL